MKVRHGHTLRELNKAYCERTGLVVEAAMRAVEPVIVRNLR
jgi:hypothetical protein